MWWVSLPPCSSPDSLLLLLLGITVLQSLTVWNRSGGARIPGRRFQSLLLCDLRDVRIGLCDGSGSVCKTIRSVLCYLSGFFCTPTLFTRHHSCAHIDQDTQLKSPNFKIVIEISSWPRCIQNFILKKFTKACLPVE